MPAILQEWLHLALRWAHVVAAILWVGDSFFFMWLDAALEAPRRARTGDVTGEAWLTHSGGFYEIVKHRSLGRLPERLHWFMWQSYTTWITGVLLVLVVYGLGGRAMLLGPTAALGHLAALGLALAVMVAGVGVYDLLCRVPALRDARALGAVGLPLIAALAWALGRVYEPRAAFLLVGATLGSVMASNVFFRIIPAQRRMLEATREGRAVDTSWGARAKLRSVHNHHLTLPVLATMLSNHFPSLYANRHAWAVLALLSVVGAGIKVMMNRGWRTPAVVTAGTLASAIGLALLSAPAHDLGETRALARHAPVELAAARSIVQTRCVTCHAARPSNASFAAPPNGVVFESVEQMEAYAPRILERVYVTRTMPLGNLTGITDAERETLGAWAYQQRGR
jgi:uncharacterized membrane protein